MRHSVAGWPVNPCPTTTQNAGTDYPGRLRSSRHATAAVKILAGVYLTLPADRSSPVHCKPKAV